MPAIVLTLTNAGRALLPANGGISAVQLTQVGLTATAVVPNAGLVALAGEFKRLNALSGAVTGPDTVSLGILDESTDTYDARAFGLYTSTGVLFAVFGQADPFVEKAAESNVALTIDIKFADVSAAELVFGDANFVIPAATQTVQGVIEIATDAEVAAKTDAVRAVTPKGLWFAFSAWVAAAFSDVWRSTNDGSGSGLDADLLDGLHGSSFLRRDGTPTAALSSGTIIAGSLARNDPFSSPIEIREVNFVAGTQSGPEYAPAVAFHWAGVNACSFKFYADGSLRARANSTSSTVYVPIYAEQFYANGNAVWHTGNDGAGSGLDADLLDGQDGSYYTNIVARLGYTPANRAGDTFTGAIRRDAAYYLDMSGANPVINFDAADFVYYERANNLLGVTINGVPQIAISPTGVLSARIGFSANGNTVWHVGNDGAGSGLDADLLDGKQAAAFLEANKDVSQSVDLSGNAPSHDVFTGTLQIREIGRVANTVTTAEYAPTICFHWGSMAASAIKMTAEGDFRFRSQSNDPNAYRNVYAAAFYSNGNGVWHAGNDGSGSGLDADLLDGQDGSYYTNIVARLGYTPLNQTSYTAADVLAKMLTVDGSGSGLDADLLDGQDSTFYTNIVARLGYTPLNQTSYSAADVLSKLVSVDGSGSGLDADLLDGKHASDFMLTADFTSGGDSNSGWRRSPDGFTDQWVRIMCNADNEASTVWPRAFSSIMDVQATAVVSATNIDDSAAIKTFDNASFTVIRTAATGTRENNYIRVRACGYTNP